MTNLSLKEQLQIEKQLSCPTGEEGIEMGHIMNKSNLDMTLNSIRFLDIRKGNSILELGHGNCGHLKIILNSSEDVQYVGLEISDTMRKESLKNNPNTQATFKLYDGTKIPYPDNHFDHIFTVNTIYFW